MQKDETTPHAPDSNVGQDRQSAAPKPEPHQSHTIRVLVWILILLSFGVLFWAVLTHHAAQKATTGRRSAMTGSVTVTTVTAEKGPIGVYLNAIGTVTPVYTNIITSQVTGLVTAVEYREGQFVRKGDPLIEIDSRPYSAQLMVAQGVLERDTNLLAQAKMDLARYQTAWSRNAIARQTLDDQEKLVLQYQGTVQADRGTVQYDKVQVSFCHLTAPISGKVGLRLVDPGNVVQANSSTPLVTITQMEPITIVFTIPEDNVREVMEQMHHGKALEVTAYDRTDQEKLATGKLLTIDNQIDTTTGTIKLRAIFPNRDGALYPNLFVNTKLLVRTLQNMTLVPTSAIQQNGDLSYVYVIRGKTVHLQNIQQGVSDSGMTAVTGVNPGDVLADSSFQKLQDGSQVTIAKSQSPSAKSETKIP